MEKTIKDILSGKTPIQESMATAEMPLKDVVGRGLWEEKNNVLKQVNPLITEQLDSNKSTNTISGFSKKDEDVYPLDILKNLNRINAPNFKLREINNVDDIFVLAGWK